MNHESHADHLQRPIRNRHSGILLKRQERRAREFVTLYMPFRPGCGSVGAATGSSNTCFLAFAARLESPIHSTVRFRPSKKAAIVVFATHSLLIVHRGFKSWAGNHSQVVAFRARIPRRRSGGARRSCLSRPFQKAQVSAARHAVEDERSSPPVSETGVPRMCLMLFPLSPHIRDPRITSCLQRIKFIVRHLG
jgi:hypothetical protein